MLFNYAIVYNYTRISISTFYYNKLIIPIYVFGKTFVFDTFSKSIFILVIMNINIGYISS